MPDQSSVTRYPIADQIHLRVSQLEDQVRHYKAIADFYQARDGDEVVADSIAKVQLEILDIKAVLAKRNANEAYEIWFAEMFGKSMPIPNTWPFTTFTQGTPWSDKVVYGMQDGEILYAEHLLAELETKQISGSIVEFGTYYGHWLQVICETLEKNNWSREVWGFDSFEGLPAPKVGFDPECWTQGMYSAPFEEVQARLQTDKRDWLKLDKGWFSESLKREPALSINKIAYARIDGDLYESCLDCLAYLDGRLVDGAIVVFDDWQFSSSIGEPRAFKEWMEAGAAGRYRFEFLEFNMWAHMYTRVHLL